MNGKNLEETTKKKNPLPAVVVVLLVIIVMLSLNLYTANKDIDNISSQNESLKESLFEFQRIVIINNADSLTKKINLDFPKNEEFRVVSFYGDHKDFTVSTIIGKPIVDDRTSIGYNYDNLYLIRAKIEENKIKFLNIEKANCKAALKRKDTVKDISFLSKAVDFVIMIGDYLLPGWQIEKNRATLISWVKDIKNLVVSSQRESIEKPILLIQNMQ